MFFQDVQKCLQIKWAFSYFCQKYNVNISVVAPAHPQHLSKGRVEDYSPPISSQASTHGLRAESPVQPQEINCDLDFIKTNTLDILQSQC